MSALAAPVPSRRGAAPARAARRAHLRLVTPDFVPEAPAPRPAAPELRRRPAAPRSGAVRVPRPGVGQVPRPGSAQSPRVAARPATPAVPAAFRALLSHSAALVLLVATVCGCLVAQAASGPAATTTTVVQAGESLWDVAEGTGAQDVAEAVAQIRELNGLSSSSVRAGQSLVVPVA